MTRATRAELPSTSRTSIDDSDVYPQAADGSTSGWLYLDLDHTRGDGFASQNWVVSSMRSGGRFSTDIDAVALGNGCSAPEPGGQFGVRRPEPPLSYRGTSGAPPPSQSGGSGRRTPNTAGQPALLSTDNDASCDIALLPAATLLLPYFEVDLDNRAGETTLFTVTNVSPVDQIARVTLWTDFAYPVLTFNVYLTGYDVQSVNLFDVLSRGVVAPDAGTGTRVTERGEHSQRNEALDLSACRSLPGALPQEAVSRMRLAFTRGRIEGCAVVPHGRVNAIGYATIDVVRNCSTNLPTNAEYWRDDLLYDNVLIGDMQQVHSANNFAQGTTLVHIRAIPEGGTYVTRGPSPFQRTFYSLYQARATPQRDGRQPLPATFAARWTQGGAGAFQTTYKIWREAMTGVAATCTQHERNWTIFYNDIVRFDEAENAIADFPYNRAGPPYIDPTDTPATSRTSVTDASIYPQHTNGAISGWMYLNLDNATGDAHASSNWVVTSMRAQGRYSVDMDAAALGNGCSIPIRNSEIATGNAVIGPAPDKP